MANERDSEVDVVYKCFPGGGDCILSVFSSLSIEFYNILFRLCFGGFYVI